jgi:hypothetical protein
MKARQYLYAGGLALAVAAALGLSVSVTQADPKKTPKVPAIQVDASWPKLPLPNSHDPRTDPAFLDQKSTATGDYKPWVTGEVAGTCVDSQDLVFIVTRGNLIAPETVTAAASGAASNGVRHRRQRRERVGGSNVLPNGIHGCFVDYQDNVWIAGNGDGIVEVSAQRQPSAAIADRHAWGVRQPAGEYLRQLGRQSFGESEPHAAEPACHCLGRSGS